MKSLIFLFFIWFNAKAIECPICLDSLKDDNTIELPCHCKFHEHCVTEQFSLQDKRFEYEFIPAADQLEFKKPFINCKDCAVCEMYIGDAFDLYLQFYKAYKNKKFFEGLELAKTLSKTKFCEQARQNQIDYINQLLSTSSMPENLKIEFLLHRFIKIDDFQNYIAQCLIELRNIALIKINKSTKNEYDIFEERRMFLDFCETQLHDTVFKKYVITFSSI